MQTIYLDGSAPEPELAGRLTHLSDPERELVLVAPADHPAAGLDIWTRRTEAVFRRSRSRAPGTSPRTRPSCRDRQPGLRTVLVGPRVDGQWPTRCDSTARDLNEAVFEILSADAMR